MFIAPPRPDLTRLDFSALPEHLRTSVSSTPPSRLFHATAAGRFERFDMTCSNGCVWFHAGRGPADKMALSFAKDRPPGLATVYECNVRFDRLAWFANECEILRFGGGGGGGDAKTGASNRLKALGYDGLVDLYDGRRKPSYAALRAETITILEVHAPR